MTRYLPRTLFLSAVVSSSWFAAAPSAHADERPWAYSPPRRPSLPLVRDRSWLASPVDAFILAKLEKVHVAPSRPADRRTLLKRLTFDLTGLMPTQAECDEFVNDSSANAVDKVVDRLLQSPHFGERWAQHWLDLVRYSETDGFKLDGFRPNAYRYRDYVIGAFNEDLPFDRFVRQQIAGDELEPGNADALIATGYLRLHPEETNGSNYRQIRQEILDDITENVGLAFLGTTIACARCHDHKFDPLAQEEYFSLQAFFAPILQRDDLTIADRGQRKDYEARMAEWSKTTEPIRTKMEALVRPVRPRVFEQYVDYLDADTRNALRCQESQRSCMQKQLAMLGGKQIQRQLNRLHWRLNEADRKEFDALKKSLESFAKLKPDSLPSAMAVSDVGPQPPPTYRLANGDYQRKKQEVQPAFPECLGECAPEIHATATSSGRRSALAQWLTRPDHPLLARVIVNRLWQHYFGHGIVGTPNDFGRMGEKPSHPELLDFLATELVRNGWRLKPIHRLIVLSSTYRQSSDDDDNPTLAQAHKSDPDNHLLWRQSVRRRDGESIRDVALQVSGKLNPRMYGPSALPELPKVLLDNKYGWYPDANPEDRNRRSVYVFHRRNLSLPILKAFDAPDRLASCAARPQTVTAPQALVLLNGEFTLAQARHIAEGLVQGKASPEQMVRQAFRQVLGREPLPAELEQSTRFLQEQRLAQDGMEANASVTDLCHGLLNSSEFLYVE